MIHIWTIPCRLFLTDRETNNATLVEVLEEVGIPESPTLFDPARGVLPAMFDVVTLWGRDHEDKPEQGLGRLSLMSPSGEAAFQHEYDVDLRPHVRTRIVAKVFGFPAQTAGRYHFRIERRANISEQWEEVARVPLSVKKAPSVGAATSQHNGSKGE
jgi:hypothetical protein